jgi:hypothetical protein
MLDLNRVNLPPVTINDTEFPVWLDTRRNAFCGEVAGAQYSAYTHDGLVEVLKTAERKTRVKVSVRFMDPSTGRVGTATGFHASTRRPLITWDDGRRNHGDDLSYPLRPDTDAEELERLQGAASAAHSALAVFERKHRLGPISLGYAIRDAIANHALQDKLAEAAQEAADAG